MDKNYSNPPFLWVDMYVCLPNQKAFSKYNYNLLSPIRICDDCLLQACAYLSIQSKTSLWKVSEKIPTDCTRQQCGRKITKRKIYQFVNFTVFEVEYL